jgi:uncharacterized integral membrane protein
MESQQEPHLSTSTNGAPVSDSAPAAQVPTSRSSPTGVPTTRAGRLWAAVIFALIALVVILVFIFQNLHDVKVSFFTASGLLPLALALLLAAVLGALIVFCLGSVRIFQLRGTVKRRSRRTRPSDS